ncbi:type I restriction-modification enzyme R subunit C-terminal domain-containing protein [Metabacillus halosaccharovorans]|uniref:type I restriction-modification enzyme R subunit C-terminal domain-containing protein n=1 Tax=Metabacillus halosaccharovorans TaxID=930124 RepID=UPI00403D9699
MLLKFAFQDFLDDRRFKNTTKINIRNYQTLLGEFVNFCIDNEVVNVEDINYSHIKKYLWVCQEKGNQAGTINTKLMRIRAFLNYMVECEVIKKNPAHKVKRQKEDVKIDVFTDEQIRQMLSFYRRIKQREKDYVAYRDYESILNVNDLRSYRKKVEHYLKEHQHEDTLAIYKLPNNKPLTKQDVEYLEQILWNELGSKEQYEKDFGDTPITKLVRKIVGLDRKTAVEAFSTFLSEENLNLQQTQFVELIIDYVVKNGTLERQALQQDPFTTLGGITVVFKDQLPKAKGILDIIDMINRNAEGIS